ncbi:probable tRNA methyltransferase 9B [Corythoichthys intestinalis]|uniref:probable tRNA methyltransferase 9B n=1 Tax=Corythoichthys intestinalis TaxID=161448 RepID=UPI0025A5C73D|nr:probable tRNA methyltransferase 9B [Corythoichthys intestinalis]XP_057695667.1 probable tRNA methyltransferase 9B [Corythoichthys intestinalis]
MDEAASRLEREHVHGVYEKIAPYFNDGRYKAWPKVRQFLLEQPPGSIVADVGCGNGKYLHINERAFKLGCDVCRPLVDFAGGRGHEVQMCDGLRLPYRDGCFDAVLSIAVIHHLSTKERRIRAIKEMARTLRAGGRLMIYVWAMEQKRRKFEKQDIFVPWNLDEHRKVRSASAAADGARPPPPPRGHWFFSRSMDSFFDFGSLSVSRPSSRDPLAVGRGLVRRFSGFFSPPSEEDVFGSDLRQGPENEKGEGGAALARQCGAYALPDLVSLPETTAESPPPAVERPPANGARLRYYHVFREGELAELVGHVEELVVRRAYFDHSNWCVVADKVDPLKR